MKRYLPLITCCLFYFLTHGLNAQDTARVSLLFLGDIMQHDSQIAAAYNPTSGKYDYSECFRLLKPYFQSADLTIGNLELTLAGKPFKGYPQFSAPDELAVALKDVGVDILVTANNHSVDRRRKGLERTIRVLDSLGILHTGTFRDTLERLNDYPLMISKGGITMALMNYTYGTNGIPVSKPNIVNLIDTALIRRDLERAKEMRADAIIVFMHWGDEYQLQPNKIQKQLAELCFKHGAMMVIGAHPHVLQPMEWNKGSNRLVAWSLGNFVSGQRPRNRDGGAMLQVELCKIITDSSMVTIIDTANYRLQWVYKTNDERSKFYVLPVATVELSPEPMIRDEISRQAFKTFVEDSRKLLRQHNKGITESNLPPPDSVVQYSVRLYPSMDSASVEWSIYPPFIYGLESITDLAGNTLIYTGMFKRREEAERYCKQINVQFPDSSVITFVNGKPIH